MDEPFKRAEFIDRDKVKRTQEAPETNLGTFKKGTVDLSKELMGLKLKSLAIPGEKSIELLRDQYQKIRSNKN